MTIPMSSFTNTSTSSLPTFNRISVDKAIELIKNIRILEQYGRLSIETSTLQQMAPNLVFNGVIRYNELVVLIITILQAILNNK